MGNYREIMHYSLLISFYISEYQYTNEIAVNYSLEQIKKFEVNCLKFVEYNLGITNFINVLQIFSQVALMILL